MLPPKIRCYKLGLSGFFSNCDNTRNAPKDVRELLLGREAIFLTVTIQETRRRMSGDYFMDVCSPTRSGLAGLCKRVANLYSFRKII